MHSTRAMDRPRANDEDAPPARGFLVRGRVQGVGFRHWTLRNARALDLSGTVRNRRDGRVEVHASGAPEDLSALEERLHRGPTTARVEGVEEIEPREELPSDFRVVH